MLGRGAVMGAALPLVDALKRSRGVAEDEFDALSANLDPETGDGRQAQIAAAAIIQENQADLFVEWHFDELHGKVMIISRNFWSCLVPFADSVDPSEVSAAFFAAVDDSVRQLRPLIRTARHLQHLLSFQQNCTSRLHVHIHSMFFATIPDWFNRFIVIFFTSQFTIWDELTERQRHVAPGSVLQCRKFASQLCPQLQELQWLAILEFGYNSALLDQIERRIRTAAAGQFISPVLAPLNSWLSSSVLTWLALMHPADSGTYRQFSARLSFFLYERLAELRIGEMFDIIVDFPDSMSAVRDLEQCLNRTDQQPLLIRELGLAIEHRLLHQGAMTRDILAQYISAFRVLRVINPSGLIMHQIVEPICNYLRNRSDTVRVVVTALLDSSSRGLLQDLERTAMTIPAAKAPAARTMRQVTEDDSAAEDDEMDGFVWDPQPVRRFSDSVVQASATSSASWWLRRSADVVSHLVHIYGHTDQLIEEYRSLLAGRLMIARDYDTATEIHHLELLKQRFGESQFHYSDVMMSDISMSKRINANIHGTANRKEFVLQGTIISREFWPSMSDGHADSTLVLPAQIVALMEEYSAHYEMLKAPRELIWKPNLGTADLTLSFKDGRSMVITDVTPAHAAILFAFQDNDGCGLSLDAICELVQMKAIAVRKRLQFWVQHNVLRADSLGIYTVLEYADAIDGPMTSQTEWSCQHRGDDDEDEEATAFSAETQQRETAKLLESYILGILPSSFGGFTLSRIDSILRAAFVNGTTSYNRSESELHDFLERLIQEGKLECIDALYKQCPKPPR